MDNYEFAIRVSGLKKAYDEKDVLKGVTFKVQKGNYNGPSCRVLEKAGFQCEGILRKNAVKNGIVQDMKMYALIKEI